MHQLHIGIFTLLDIAEGQEITIDFDYPYDSKEYVVECACGQDTCLVDEVCVCYVVSILAQMYCGLSKHAFIFLSCYRKVVMPFGTELDTQCANPVRLKVSFV